jgi:hypothetical protein
VKRLFIILLALTACKTAAPMPPGPSGNTTGAATPRGAVELFLRAVKAQDLQAMSVVWGGHDGLARDVLPRDQVEKRELIMQCYFGHDNFRIVSSSRPRRDEETFQVALTKGTLTRTTTFTAMQGPSGRWYVGDADLGPTKDLCRQS